MQKDPHELTHGGSGTHRYALMGVVEPMGRVEQDPDAGYKIPFCDVLSILCVLSSFVESGNGFVDPRLIPSSSESMSRV